MFAEMLSDWPGRILLGLMVATVVTGGVGLYLTIEEGEQFMAFASAHCRQIGSMSGDLSTGLGISANGQTVLTTSMTPGKTGYACDDGQEYWR